MQYNPQVPYEFSSFARILFVIYFHPMILGLLIICFYAILRRSGKPWRTAGRMFLLFFVLFIVLVFIFGMFPKLENSEAFKLLSMISIITATILVGFQQARNLPRSAQK